MRAHQAQYPIATMPRVLKVSRSGFHAWLAREPSAREKQDLDLIKIIRTEHIESDGTCGAPRLHRALVGVVSPADRLFSPERASPLQALPPGGPARR